MTSPTLNTAGDTTTHRLGCFDINTGTALAPNWLTCQYVNDYNLNPDNANMTDATVFADGGYGGQDKVGTAWQLDVVLNHMIVPGSNPPIYDPSHDWLEQHGVGQLGAANRVQLRMYDFDPNDVAGVITPRGQAYMGWANYSWPGFGTGKSTDPRMVSISFLGKGRLVKIAHPYPATPSVPVIDSAAPLTASTAGGGQCVIHGHGFTGVTGATGVKFGTANAPAYTVVSDVLIVADIPAHAAGNAQIIVTNGTGPSTTGPNVVYA